MLVYTKNNFYSIQFILFLFSFSRYNDYHVNHLSSLCKLEEYKHPVVKEKGHLHKDGNENVSLERRQDLGSSVGQGRDRQTNPKNDKRRGCL